MKVSGYIILPNTNRTNYTLENNNIIYNYKILHKLKIENGSIREIFFCKVSNFKNEISEHAKKFPFLDKQYVELQILDINGNWYIENVICINTNNEYYDKLPKKKTKKYSPELEKMILIWQKIRLTLNINDTLTQKIYDYFRKKISADIEEEKNIDNFLEVIKTNPYILMEDCNGFGLQLCNKIADFLCISENNENRVYYNILYNIPHTIMPKYILEEKSSIIRNIAFEKNIIDRKNFNIIERVAKEQELAKILCNFCTVNNKNITIDKGTLNDIQFEAVKKSFTHNFLVITGSGGTGKTYTMEKIIEQHHKHGSKMIITTISHKALSKYNNLTYRDIEISVLAGIVHRDIYHTIDVLVIDETSMLGIEDLLDLFAKIEFNSLIFIGDYEQLPSINYGNLFEDIVKGINNEFIIKLTKQERCKNDVILNKVSTCLKEKRHNYIPYYDNQNTDGIYKININYETEDENINFVCKEFNKLINKYGIKNTFIITYKNNTVEKLNIILNGKNGEIKVGDKVKCIKNSTSEYNDKYYNNQFGIVSDIYDSSKNTLVDILSIDDDKTISSIPYEHLKLGYAVTCHSFQGSEADAIIVYCDSISDYNWINTAFGRGKKFILCIYTNIKEKSGDNLNGSLNKKLFRQTKLKEFLIENFKNIPGQETLDDEIVETKSKDCITILDKRKKYNSIEREQVWKRYFKNEYEVKCPYCRYTPINANRFEMAHIVAHKKGGSSELSNIVPLCSVCNKTLGTNEIDMSKYTKGIVIK